MYFLLYINDQDTLIEQLSALLSSHTAWVSLLDLLLNPVYNGVGSCSALEGHCTLSGHNFYGENYIPMEGHQKLGGTSPLPP